MRGMGCTNLPLNFVLLKRLCDCGMQKGLGMFSRICKILRPKFKNLQDTETQVQDFDEAYHQLGSNADLTHLNASQARNLHSMSEEETYWKQKARICWMMDGDRNSKLFYPLVAIKRSKLAIKLIKFTKSVWLEDFHFILAHATDNFQNLLSADTLPNEEAMTYFLEFIPALVSQADNE